MFVLLGFGTCQVAVVTNPIACTNSSSCGVELWLLSLKYPKAGQCQCLPDSGGICWWLDRKGRLAF